MRYLTDYRAGVRDDPRNLLPSARSVISAGKLYHTPWPKTTEFDEPARAWISRYAWGSDYHDVVRRGLERLDGLLGEAAGPFESRVLVDTAPLLERSYARLLGWDGSQEYLSHQPAARVLVFPGRTAGLTRDRTGCAGGGPLRHVPPVHRRVSDGGHSAFGDRFQALHFLLYD